jgi:carbon-monoxide dehydrogenase medium subunit
MKFVSAAGFIPTSARSLPAFGLRRPTSIAEAVHAFDDAKQPMFLAGGTDLPAQFNEGFTPINVIDLERVAELREIKLAGDALEIGATVTHASGSTHALIKQHLPSLGTAWARIANVRIRFSATMGGNLMARRTRYEGSILLSALGARLRFKAAAGETELAVEDLWRTDLPSLGLLTTIVVPLRPGLRLDYARELRPIMTQAVAFDDAGKGRVVTATEHSVPCVRTLTGAEPGAVQDALNINDPVTSEAYVRRLSETLLVRQIERMRVA